MNAAIILDCETTGIDEPDVIQLAWLPLVSSWEPGQKNLCLPGTGPGERGGVYAWRPRKPITFGAMAAHHIIPEDLKDEPEWPGRWELPPATDYLVGPSVDYDWKAIGSPPVRRICTLAIARKLWPEVDSHSLSALVYYLMESREAARNVLKGAHSAMTDAGLCHFLLTRELERMPLITTWERLWAASERARIPDRMPLGKYGPKNGQPGMLIEELRRADPDYVSWCVRQDFDPYLLKALRGETA